MAEKTSETDTRKSDPKIGEFPTMEQFTNDGLSFIVEGTKAVNMFPSGASRDLYCAYPTFGKVVDTTSDRILGLILGVLRNQNIRGNIQRRERDEQFEILAECNDVMLEKINSNLDEMAGIRRNPQNVTVETPITQKINVLQNTQGVGSWNVSRKPESLSKSPLTLLTGKNIPRPQVNFKTAIDNSPDRPFEPKIKDKPNALKPLAILPEYDEDGNIESYLHPYEFELMKFEPSESDLQSTEAKLPKSISNTSYKFIETVEHLSELIYDLRNANVKEIAIDVEHHSYRSFQGISCLIQLSTKFKDYIIDALKLRDELHALNEIFTNRNILKIFHGADLDIQWLQRDFSLYIVNMFDTHQAAKILGFPRLSLAYLLKHFCSIDADKTYQLADWRVRPLPEELIHYARQDTHYLIYIYELLRNELITKANNESNLLKTVYQKSTDICRKRYIKPTITTNSHMDLYRKSKKIFDNRQLYALREIFQWRDMISRKEDESYGYVLPNHMMLQIAESLPREMQGILACCNPIPPLVRQNLYVLHQIILKARDQPLIKPILEHIENRVIVNTTIDTNDKLYCPHELLNDQEFRDDLPTLLGDNKNEEPPQENSCSPILAVPLVSVFENLTIFQDEYIEKKLNRIRKVKFVTPYERYKAVIPYAEQQKLEEIAQEEAIRKSKQLCPVKNEPDIEKDDDDDDKYKLPTKKDLKRKHENNGESSSKIENLSKKVKKRNTTATKEKQTTIFAINVKNNEDVEKDNKTNQNENQSSSSPQEGAVADANADTVKNENQEMTSASTINERKRSKKFNKRMKAQPRVKTGQSSNQPIQFDYSKVDFTKFQGGAQKSQAPAIKPKFHGKNKAAINASKKFNKLFTFSKTNKK